MQQCASTTTAFGREHPGHPLARCLRLPGLACIGLGALCIVFSPRALAEVPELASKPDAAHSIFLDFDGHRQAAVTFHCFDPASGLTTLGGVPAIDVTGPSKFVARLARDMWQAVAEDFAPFDVNVTTVEPVALQGDAGEASAGRALRVVVGSSEARLGEGTLGWSPTACPGDTVYQSPAIPNTVVVDTAIGGVYADPWNRARAASHEAGHALGLAHYAAGVGASNSAAPIMSYSLHGLYRWAEGSNEFNVWQSDLHRLDGQLGRRADDHADSDALASVMTQAATADARVFAHGVIEHESDWDYLTFRVTERGQVSVRLLLGAGVEPQDLYPTDGLEPNLAPALVLSNRHGRVLASGSSFSLTALGPRELALPGQPPPLNAGEYYHLAVHSRGGYGNLGHFTVLAEGPVADLSGPRVIESSTNCLADGLHTLTLTFDQALYLPSPGYAGATPWVSVQGPAGPVAVNGIQPVPVGSTVPKTFEIALQPQTLAGWYAITVGPAIEALGSDPSGQPYRMDQDDDGINGEAQDDVYTTGARLGGYYACAPEIPPLQGLK